MLYELDLSSMITCGMAGRFYRHGRASDHRRMRSIGRNLLVFVVSGTAIGETSGLTYRLSKGSVWLVPSGTPYRLLTDEGCEFYFFRFRGQMELCSSRPHYSYNPSESALVCQHIASKRICLSDYTELSERYDEFMHRLECCVALSKEPVHSSQLLFCIEFERILILLSTIGEEEYRDKKIPPVLRRITEYIRENVTEKLSVGEISERFSLSRSYISRLFRRHYDCSLTEYIRRGKMDYARKLLKYETMNVSEVADYLGYENVYYFSRVYKETFRQSPTKDRRDD
ncbi:MAG: helix-turn-helix domain-containing protein [Clostridia bacterium]|nr:helix-turn-helix domain-containing protein [Clostridia bacterium]